MVQAIGSLATVTGLVRGAVWNQRWGGVLLLAGLALLFWIQPVWMWAMLVAAGLAWILSTAARRRGWFDPRDRGLLLTVGCVMAGAAVSTWLAMPPYWEFNESALRLLDRYAAMLPDFFDPQVRGIGDFYPGLEWWAMVGVLGWSAFSGRRLQAGTQFLVVEILGVSFLPVPGLTRLWVGYFSEAFAAPTNFPLNFRLLPPMMALACGGAFSWLVLQSGARRTGVVVVLALVASWSVAQARFFAEAGAGRTSTRTITSDWMRSENGALARYAYELLPLPQYFSHGGSDPRLESRIFDDRHRLIAGPGEIAATMEKAGRENILLTATVEPTRTAWLNLHPQLTLAPG